ncbi:unnamed protein product [Prorocentrum cordatum]|uniref:ubiquitinyl hydrolase 1 n=1 Tax=Prorocentrum cordatum TaxID=2364126 RepID=A0ABN9UF63_9DINO|nr:unnamed protein product [Polarella glacialis]
MAAVSTARLRRKLGQDRWLEDMIRAARQQGDELQGPVLRVAIQGATDLVPRSCAEGRDLYCTCEVAGRARSQVRTRTVDGAHEPAWDYESRVIGYSLGDSLAFAVWARAAGRPDECLGRATLRSEQFYPSGFAGRCELEGGCPAKEKEKEKEKEKIGRSCKFCFCGSLVRAAMCGHGGAFLTSDLVGMEHGDARHVRAGAGRQLGGLCGVHCLNNLLQGPHFGPGDLAEIGVQLDREERQLLEGAGGGAGGDGLEEQPYNVDPSADGGNFSIQVLALALKRFGLELLPSNHPDARELMKDPPKAAGAFLCQYRDHWFAIREIASCWWNLNSTRRRPAMVSPFFLAAWLGQLGEEGHSIFLVRGAAMPEPARPAEAADGQVEENFHELGFLLDKSRESGGNPLQGDDGSDGEVVIPPDTDAPLGAMLPGALGPFPGAMVPGLALNPFEQQQQQMLLHQLRALQQGGLAEPPGSAGALREMGFGEAQVRAAEALAAGGPPSAQDWRLLAHADVAPGLAADPLRLGQAIQEAVVGLERSPGSALDACILRLVALLSVEGAARAVAARHTDGALLSGLAASVLAEPGPVVAGAHAVRRRGGAGAPGRAAAGRRGRRRAAARRRRLPEAPVEAAGLELAVAGRRRPRDRVSVGVAPSAGRRALRGAQGVEMPRGADAEGSDGAL